LPKVVDEVAQRARIRGAARRVFAKRGLAKTGLVHVAAAAGLRRSSLYHYYPDKSALVRDLANDLLRAEEAMFRSALSEAGDALERIERLCEQLIALFEERAALGRVLLELWATEPGRVRPVLRRVRRALSELLRLGQERGEIDASLDPEPTAVLLVALLDGLLVQVFVDPRTVRIDDELRRTFVGSVRRLLSA
jgi:AcrR family transcriptional regulator